MGHSTTTLTKGMFWETSSPPDASSLEKPSRRRLMTISGRARRDNTLSSSVGDRTDAEPRYVNFTGLGLPLITRLGRRA
jgi:hypothetical protein